MAAHPDDDTIRRLRIVMFLYKSGERDSRVLREADALGAAGHSVTLVAIPADSAQQDVTRDRIGSLDVVRVPVPSGWQRTWRSLRRPGRYWSRAAYRFRTGALVHAAGLVVLGSGAMVLAAVLSVIPLHARLRPGSPNKDLVEWLLRWRFGILAWGAAAAAAAPAADVYHAHDLTALGAAVQAARMHGVPYVYDSHEVFMESGSYARRPGWIRRLFTRAERRWARGAAAVVTVNDAVAEELSRRLRPRQVVVVHNTSPRWDSPGAVDLLRAATGIPADARVALSHGGFSPHRGLEELVLALLEPAMHDVHVVLMGFGALESELRALVAQPRFRGRAHVLPAVAPDALLPWVASADVGVMAIQPSTLNHRLATPNKLFECLAAGVPVVAGDLPAMRAIVLADPAAPLGELCDPYDPASIADAIGRVVHRSESERAELRARCRRAAHERWNWETDSVRLVDLYRRLADSRPGPGRPT